MLLRVRICSGRLHFCQSEVEAEVQRLVRLVRPQVEFFVVECELFVAEDALFALDGELVVACVDNHLLLHWTPLVRQEDLKEEWFHEFVEQVSGEIILFVEFAQLIRKLVELALVPRDVSQRFGDAIARCSDVFVDCGLQGGIRKLLAEQPILVFGEPTMYCAQLGHYHIKLAFRAIRQDPRHLEEEQGFGLLDLFLSG